MPLKDSRYEFVRPRPRKEKEKDHDKDARSVGGNSVTTIRDRKHRNSTSSNLSGSLETASLPSATSFQDVALEQLSPLPEPGGSESASTATSPTARTNSNIFKPASGTSPSQIATPAKLQPYLESVCDTESTVTVTDRKQHPASWIGPHPDTVPSSSHPFRSDTPTPRFNDFVGSGGTKVTTHGPEQLTEDPASVNADAEDGSNTEPSSEANTTVNSLAGSGMPHEQSYHPSQMANPFLPINYLPTQERRLTTTRSSTNPNEFSPALPKAPSPPLPRQCSPRVKFESPHHPPADPTMTRSMGSGYDHLMAPPLPPIPMHQTYPSPIPYADGTAIMDHPANILHRIGSVLPDISALMNLYQSTCNSLTARDHHISHLQSQKAAEAEQQGARIERLAGEIESILGKDAAEIQKLQDDIVRLEEKHHKLKESLAKEKKLKEDSRAALASLKIQQAETENQHHEHVQGMKDDFTREKAKMMAEHSAHERKLLDEMDTKVRNAEAHLTARLAEMDRKHEIDKQAHEERWLRRNQDMETGYADMCRELRNTISAKGNMLEEERRNFSRARDGWNNERDAMASRWDEERYHLKQDADDRYQIAKIQHQSEIEDKQKAMEATLLRHQSEAQDTILKLEREKEGIRQQLEATHVHYEAEIQVAASNFRREKEEYAKSTDEALWKQKSDFQDKIRQLQRDKDDLLRSRMPSQSRQGPDVGETISRVQREVETLKAGSSSDKGRWPKPAPECRTSRSSTPTPKEDRNKLRRASGVYGSGTSLKSKGVALEQQSRNEGHV